MELSDIVPLIVNLPSLFSRGGAKNVQGKHNVYQGTGTDRDNKVYHAYYQWVALFLFMQGISFNVPHFLWSVWEDEKMDRITVTLRGLIKIM